MNYSGIIGDYVAGRVDRQSMIAWFEKQYTRSDVRPPQLTMDEDGSLDEGDLTEVYRARICGDLTAKDYEDIYNAVTS